MPLCRDHHFGDGGNVSVGNFVMKKVAHGVDEDHLRRFPAEWFGEFFGNQAKVKALFVRMAFYSAEALSKSLSVAVLAAWGDFCAATDGIPCRVCPFDVRGCRHRIYSLLPRSKTRCPEE